MVFTNACYLDFEKEWERNRQVFLLSLKTESIYYTFFQLNRHKFDSVFSFDFSQEKYAVCFSLLHANSQLMYIYNQILFSSKKTNDELLSKPDFSASKTNLLSDFCDYINLLFEDLFIRIATCLDLLTKALALFSKKSNTKPLWSKIATQNKNGTNLWNSVIIENKVLFDCIYDIRSDFLHGSVKPVWIVINRFQNDSSTFSDTYGISFSLNYRFHSTMRTVIRELRMQTDFNFFDFVFNVVKRFYSFENELIECFSKVFDPSFIINQYNELDGDFQVDKLTTYEESVLKQYNLIKDK